MQKLAGSTVDLQNRLEHGVYSEDMGSAHVPSFRIPVRTEMFQSQMRKGKTSELVVHPSSSLRSAAQACPLLQSDRAKGAWIDCCTRRFVPMARRIAGNDALAEDALQVSWMKIIQATNTVLGGPKACPWVAKVITNTIRDAQRKERRHREVPLESAGALVARQNVELEVQERQMLELLREVVRMLPSTYRRVYELRIQQDLSTKETAERLNITRSNVSTILYRTVKMIEHKLNKRLRTSND